MVQFKKIMKFNYLFFFIFISINTYSIENYEAEYRFKSSEINLKGKRVLTINEDGISSLSFKAKSTLARLYFETNFFLFFLWNFIWQQELQNKKQIKKLIFIVFYDFNW